MEKKVEIPVEAKMTVPEIIQLHGYGCEEGFCDRKITTSEVMIVKSLYRP